MQPSGGCFWLCSVQVNKGNLCAFVWALYAFILGLKILGKDGIPKAKYITQSVSEKPWQKAYDQLIS